MTPRFAEFVASIDRTPMGTADFLVGLNQRLQRENPPVDPHGAQRADAETLMSAGSCRDSGWLLVETLRQLGLAARFVSGYLLQLAPDVKSIDGPSGTEVDFTDLHVARCTCRARAGSASIRPPACSPGKGTFRSPARPNPAARRRSPARSTNPKSSSKHCMSD